MNIPQLSFIYAYPLDRGQRALCEASGKLYPTTKEVQEQLVRITNLWQNTEQSHGVMQQLIEVTARTPKRNLECFVFGAGLNVMSTPFLLPIWSKAGEKWTDGKIIELIIHELLHIFLTTDNKPYWNMVQEKYAAEEPSCQNHLLLYAMLYDVYQKIFATEPLDFRRDNLPPGYARAVALVKDLGYQELISEYRSMV